MALTPEDVVNKRFQQTKFREGYDQDEVDDFLDEVVVELRRLYQENDDLKQKLSNAEAGKPATAPSVIPAPAPSIAKAESGELGLGSAESSNNLLQLARKLHDEHVKEGVEKRDALIAEGHATAARIVSEAETNGKATVAKYETQVTELEARVAQLTGFENEYRTSLKRYIEGQLKDLDTLTANPNK